MGTPSDLAALNATGDQGRTGKPKYITDGADLGGADPATGVADLSGEPSREDSLVPMAARAAGLDFQQLVLAILAASVAGNTAGNQESTRG